MDLIKDSSKEYYSQREVADNYDEERFTTVAGRMVDRFEKNVVISNLPENPEGVKVLDVGAGSGRFTVEMAMRGFNVVACDYSPVMLDIIKSKVEEVGLENRVVLSRQDVTNLTFERNEFDFISCIRVFVNLDAIDNERKALDELVRVCKPGGTIVFEIVNPLSVASLGPVKRSMITLKEAKELISATPEIEIKKCFGRRIMSQTALEKAPDFLVKSMDMLDHILSKIFPFFCVRIYFVLEKIKGGTD